jgi:hypothetical protein
MKGNEMDDLSRVHMRPSRKRAIWIVTLDVPVVCFNY